MSINKTYAVFGLGQYGLAIARELVKSGADVLAVDIDEQKVNKAALEIPLCKCADVTNADVIRRLGVSNIDVVIIAMANNLEASVLSVMLCKEVGVKTVIVKSGDEMQNKILTKIGADKIVFPERESGVRLAKNILSSGFIDLVELSEDVSIVELNVKNEWLGKTLIELNLRKKYSFNVVAIKRGETIDVDVDPTEPLTDNEKLVVIVKSSKLSKIR